MDTNKIWFTSDHHFGHKNIIEFSKRPFANADEMNAEMVKRWNEKVGQDDLVYHLGDFALMSSGKVRQLRAQLNGRICLITGNHESSALECADCFEWIKDYYELTRCSQRRKVYCVISLCNESLECKSLRDLAFVWTLTRRFT